MPTRSAAHPRSTPGPTRNPGLVGTTLRAVPNRLGELARRQAGVLTRSQLQAGGFGPGPVRAAVVARRWQSFGRHVVVLHNAALTAQQRQWVAVLLPGKPAALAGATAAALAGLTGYEDDDVHIVVALDSNAGYPPWVRVHNSRRFEPAHIASASPPRTSPARSVLDAASWQPHVRRAVAILCAGVQQRVTTAGRLARELESAGSIRHVGIMRAVIGDIGGGAHTLDELALAPLARRAGLPPPRRQALRREADGRARYVDAEFDLPDGQVLIVEVDGAVHLRPQTMWDDMQRQNEIVIGGSPILRFSSVDVRLDPDRVVEQLRRMRDAHARR